MDTMTKTDAARLLGIPENAAPAQIQAAYDQEINRYKRIENSAHPVTSQDFMRLAVAKTILETPGDVFGGAVTSAARPCASAETTMASSGRMVGELTPITSVQRLSYDQPVARDETRPIFNNPRDTYSLVAPQNLSNDQLARTGMIQTGLGTISRIDRWVALCYALAAAGLVGIQVMDAIDDLNVDMQQVKIFAYPAMLVLIFAGLVLQDVIGDKKRAVNKIIHNFNSVAKHR